MDSDEDGKNLVVDFMLSMPITQFEAFCEDLGIDDPASFRESLKEVLEAFKHSIN